jgi:hypothetical protein
MCHQQFFGKFDIAHTAGGMQASRPLFVPHNPIMTPTPSLGTSGTSVSVSQKADFLHVSVFIKNRVWAAIGSHMIGFTQSSQ